MKTQIADILKKLKGDGVKIEVGGEHFTPKRVVPSGSFLLDWMLGVGGLPSGRLIELAGDEGGGKSTISLVCAASMRKHNQEVVWIDAEHSFDEWMAKEMGATDLIVMQPHYGEEALSAARKFVDAEGVGLVVIDSAAALVPKAELEAEFASDVVAAQARMLSLKLRQIFTDMQPDSSTIILINQVRDKVGQSWGDTTTTPGGRSPKHWAHIRIRVGKGKMIESGNRKVGRIAHLTYLKSKMTSPDKFIELPLLWGKGIDEKVDLLEAGILLGLVEKSAGRYSGLWPEALERTQEAAGSYPRNWPEEHLQELRELARKELDRPGPRTELPKKTQQIEVKPKEVKSRGLAKRVSKKPQ